MILKNINNKPSVAFVHRDNLNAVIRHYGAKKKVDKEKFNRALLYGSKSINNYHKTENIFPQKDEEKLWTQNQAFIFAADKPSLIAFPKYKSTNYNNLPHLNNFFNTYDFLKNQFYYIDSVKGEIHSYEDLINYNYENPEANEYKYNIKHIIFVNYSSNIKQVQQKILKNNDKMKQNKIVHFETIMDDEYQKLFLVKKVENLLGQTVLLKEGNNKINNIDNYNFIKNNYYIYLKNENKILSVSYKFDFISKFLMENKNNKNIKWLFNFYHNDLENHINFLYKLYSPYDESYLQAFLNGVINENNYTISYSNIKKYQHIVDNNFLSWSEISFINSIMQQFKYTSVNIGHIIYLQSMLKLDNIHLNKEEFNEFIQKIDLLFFKTYKSEELIQLLYLKRDNPNKFNFIEINQFFENNNDNIVNMIKYFIKKDEITSLKKKQTYTLLNFFNEWFYTSINKYLELFIKLLQKGFIISKYKSLVLDFLDIINNLNDNTNNYYFLLEYKRCFDYFISNNISDIPKTMNEAFIMEKYYHYLNEHSFNDNLLKEAFIQNISGHTLVDLFEYKNECEQLDNSFIGRTLDIKNLQREHDNYSQMLTNLKKDDDNINPIFVQKYNGFKKTKITLNKKQYIIEYPKRYKDLTQEANALGHCLSHYSSNIAYNNELVLFLRKKVNEPFITFSLNENISITEIEGENHTKPDRDFINTLEQQLKNNKIINNGVEQFFNS